MDSATERITARLAPFTNYERTRPTRARFSLDTMHALLAALQPAAPRFAVQIGGSKGKGTTAAWLETIAQSAGLRTGVYGSPHVSTILERVRIDGEHATEAELMSAIDRVLAAGVESPSFFEIMTAAAALVFADRGIDLAIWEVGLGGRLDATTAIPVDASIFTNVELEHTELLGDTVEKIAAEKAWILRPDRPGFTGVRPPALAVVEEHAARVGCRLQRIGHEILGEVGVAPDHLTVDVPEAGESIRAFGALPHEGQSILLARACARELFETAPDRDLRRAELPGRFEVVESEDGGVWILDGAHTAESSRLVASEVRRRNPGRPVALLFASATGKRWRDVLSPWVGIADRAVVTVLSDTPSEDPDAMSTWLSHQRVPARAVLDPADAVAELRRHDGVRVVTGSFYLVGAVRSSIRDSV